MKPNLVVIEKPTDCNWCSRALEAGEPAFQTKWARKRKLSFHLPCWENRLERLGHAAR